MTDWMPILFWPIFLPLAGALLVLAMPKRVPFGSEALALLAALGNLVLAGYLFGESVSCSFAWCAGLEFRLRLYSFSAFLLLAVAVFSFLPTLPAVWLGGLLAHTLVVPFVALSWTVTYYRLRDAQRAVELPA